MGEKPWLNYNLTSIVFEQLLYPSVRIYAQTS